MMRMREKYLDLFWSEVKRGRIFHWPLRLLGAPLSSRCNRMLTGPLSVEILLTWRCNANCEMCDYSGRAEDPELSTGEIIGIIDELAGLGVGGVSLSGGEPFLRLDLFEIVRHAKRRNLLVQIATNGLLLDQRNAELLVETSVDVVTVSLDSPDPEIFSTIRGVPDIYNRVVRGIGHLAASRKRQGGGPKVVISTIITGRTINDIPDLLELSEGLGAQGLTLLTAQNVETIDNQLNESDTQRLMNLFRYLLARKEEGDRFLDNSAGYLQLMLSRLAGRCDNLRCFVPYTNLHIGPRGEVFPCSYHVGLNQPWGNIRESSIRDLWFSSEYQCQRRELLGCQRCSIYCHWELNLLLHKMFLPRLLKG